MATVTLTRADIALLSDLGGSRLTLNSLQVLVPSESVEQVFVRFEGDRRATGWRGEGETLEYQMTARFVRGEHADAATLIEMFRTAHRDDSDGRLLLRLHVGEVGGLNDVEAVMVPSWSAPWQRGGVVDVSFTARAVDWSQEV